MFILITSRDFTSLDIAYKKAVKDFTSTNSPNLVFTRREDIPKALELAQTNNLILVALAEPYSYTECKMSTTKLVRGFVEDCIKLFHYPNITLLITLYDTRTLVSRLIPFITIRAYVISNSLRLVNQVKGFSCQFSVLSSGPDFWEAIRASFSKDSSRSISLKMANIALNGCSHIQSLIKRKVVIRKDQVDVPPKYFFKTLKGKKEEEVLFCPSCGILLGTITGLDTTSNLDN